MIRLDQFVQIKDHCGICYLGRSDEYLVQLLALRPILEQKFGMTISVIARDACPIPGVVKTSEVRPDQFLHVLNLTYNSDGQHPVETVLNEAEINECQIAIGDAPRTVRCVIITQGNYPTKPLTRTQVMQLQITAEREGYEPVVNEEAENAGLVMGVESVQLFQAALAGVETRLVPTGIGTRLYRRMFPNGKILKLS